MSIEAKLAIVIAVLVIVTYLMDKRKEPRFIEDDWTYETDLRFLKVSTVFTFIDSQDDFCVINDDGMTFSYIDDPNSMWRINEMNRNVTVRVQGVMTDG